MTNKSLKPTSLYWQSAWAEEKNWAGGWSFTGCLSKQQQRWQTNERREGAAVGRYGGLCWWRKAPWLREEKLPLPMRMMPIRGAATTEEIIGILMKMTNQEEQQPQPSNSDNKGSSSTPKIKDETGVDRCEKRRWFYCGRRKEETKEKRCCSRWRKEDGIGDAGEDQRWWWG